MQITFDPRDLSPAQRLHVASFLTEWPGAVTLADSHWPPPDYSIDGPGKPAVAEPRFDGKTETQLLAEEQAADLQPQNPADDNTDTAAARAVFGGDVPERDIEGLPWDRRIHSSSKARNADGRWRIARNVTPELVESVKAELRALVAAPVNPVDVLRDVAQQVADANGLTVDNATFDSAAPFAAQVPPPPAPAYAVATSSFAAAVTAIQATAPAIIEAAQVPPPPAAPAATSDTAAPDLTLMFTTLLKEAGQAVVAGKLTSADLTAICQRHGVANVGLLAARKDLVPQIDAEFRALVAGK